MFFNHKKPKNVMSVMCGERLINFNIWYKRITLVTPLDIFVIEKCSNPNLKWIQIINLYLKKKKKKKRRRKEMRKICRRLIATNKSH